MASSWAHELFVHLEQRPRAGGGSAAARHLRLVHDATSMTAGGTRDALERAIAAVRADPDARLFVDFDHTLARINTSEAFFDLARPRWLVALVFDLLDVVAPWRWRGRTREAARDPLRLCLLTLLAPWTWLAWARRARAGEGGWINPELAARLRGVPRRQIVVVSLGCRGLIAPLLANSQLCGVELIASPLWRGRARLRSEGKARHLRDRFGDAVVARSAAVTDSVSDRDLLDVVAWPCLRTWPDQVPHGAHLSAYYPLRYVHRVKYPGKGIVRRQLIGEDLVVALLVFGAPMLDRVEWPDPMGAALACVALVAGWLSFHTAYELGYEENDRLGARTEARPTLSTHALRETSVRTWPGAATWSVALGAVAAASSAATAMSTSARVGLWSMVPAALATWAALASWAALAWVGIVLATRGLFAVFNRLEVHRRVIPFFGLQALKSLGLAVFAITGPAGVALALGQIMRQGSNYLIYRFRGDNRAFRRQLHRAVVFGGVLTALTLATRDPAPWRAPSTWLMVAWCAWRLVVEEHRFARYDVDARHRDHLMGRTDVRPGEA